MKIWKDFTFEAAHKLPNVPQGHKCARLHGHSYMVRLLLTGNPDPVTGMIMDFADIAKLWEPLHAELDHRYLNEVPGLQNPTTELLATWIWNKLHVGMALGSVRLEVVVSESHTTGCLFDG